MTAVVRSAVMTSPHLPVLEFPEMLHGLTGAVRRKVGTQGRAWAREYLKTGGFTQPRQMLQVAPGELMEMHSGMVFDAVPQARWRFDMFSGIFMNFNEGLPEQEHSRARELLDSFCMGTPWGALFHAVSPYPPRSAARMSQRLAALLRFWDILQIPSYVYRLPDIHQTLDGLMDYIYRETLEAWCPQGPSSVREHMTLAIERMSRATREECTEVLLRVIPVLIAMDSGLKHLETLNDPEFLRERLAALPSKNFDSISSAYKYAVSGPLIQWDRELGRH